MRTDRKETEQEVENRKKRLRQGMVSVAWKNQEAVLTTNPRNSIAENIFEM